MTCFCPNKFIETHWDDYGYCNLDNKCCTVDKCSEEEKKKRKENGFDIGNGQVRKTPIYNEEGFSNENEMY